MKLAIKFTWLIVVVDLDHSRLQAGNLVLLDQLNVVHDDFILTHLLAEKCNTVKTEDFSVADPGKSSHLWDVHEDLVFVVFDEVPFGTSELRGKRYSSLENIGRPNAGGLGITRQSLTISKDSLTSSNPDSILMSRMAMFELFSFPV